MRILPHDPLARLRFRGSQPLNDVRTFPSRKVAALRVAGRLVSTNVNKEPQINYKVPLGPLHFACSCIQNSGLSTTDTNNAFFTPPRSSRVVRGILRRAVTQQWDLEICSPRETGRCPSSMEQANAGSPRGNPPG